MKHTLRIDPAMSVNDVLCLYPAALPALNAAGIDTCCGGAEPLAAAAHEAGADLDALVGRILALADPAHAPASGGAR